MKQKIVKIRLFSCILALVGLISCEKTKEIKVTEKEVLEETNTYVIKAKYPVFDLEELDREVVKTFDDYVQTCKKESAEQAHEEWFVPFELVENYRTEILDNRYVSVNLQVYYSSGGAHGMTFNNTLTYDAKAKKFLQIAELLGGDERQFVKMVKEKLKKKLDEGNFVDDGVVDVQSLGKFILTSAGVEFIFNPYEVAAYAYGTVSVLVAYDEYPFNLENEKSEKQ